MKKEKMPTRKALDRRLLINVLFLILTFVVLLNLFLIFQIKQGIVPPMQPPELEIVTLVDTSCEQCQDMEDLKRDLYFTRYRISNQTSVEYQSAQNLIDLYNISRVPAMIIKTDTERIFLPFPVINGAYVYDYTEPPYVDPQSGEVKGFITATIIKAPNCNECTTPDQLIEDIKHIAQLEKITELDFLDDRAKELILKHEIKRLPTIMLSKEANEYKVIKDQWPRVGIINEEGEFVMTKTPAPYLDTQSNTVKGLVTMDIIYDESCNLCYNASIHNNNLKQLGITINDINYIEKNSQQAKDLIAKYNINTLPTFILSSEAKEYPVLDDVWKDVGSFEEDGSFVFRNHDSIEKSKVVIIS